MPASAARPRRRMLAGPLLPLGGVVVGLGLLTALVALPGPDTPPDPAAEVTDVTRAVAAPTPATPAPGTCTLLVADQSQALELARARTLTQIAAVGQQVAAPTEMAARALDMALAAGPAVPTVTEALNLFTREDTAVPSASALSELAALTAPGALNCVFAAPAGERQDKANNGLTARAQAARQGVLDAFGKVDTGGYGKKARSGPERAGRAVVVSAPTNVAGEPAGWVLAHWLTARGSEYLLETVQVGEHAWRPTVGWTPRAGGTAAAADEVALTVVEGAEKVAKKSSKSDKKSAKKDRNKEESGKKN